MGEKQLAKKIEKLQKISEDMKKAETIVLKNIKIEIKKLQLGPPLLGIK